MNSPTQYWAAVDATIAAEVGKEVGRNAVVEGFSVVSGNVVIISEGVVGDCGSGGAHL